MSSNCGQIQLEFYYYINVGCSACLKTRFELHPDTESKQGTCHFLSKLHSDLNVHIQCRGTTSGTG